LQGLEKHLKIASQMKDFDKGDKWMDLDVTTWPVVEQFQQRMQTDGYVDLSFLDGWVYTCTNSALVQLILCMSKCYLR
jgi:hypothetical protein